MKILITGAAGFIGHHLVLKLTGISNEIIGLDSINSYYDINLKLSRLIEQGIEIKSNLPGIMNNSSKHPNYRFIQLNIENHNDLEALFLKEKFDCICHLAAQSGVRYSTENPQVYIESNILGLYNILECCRKYAITHLIYASSSSVYGNNKSIPFSENLNVDKPKSLYAATKKSNELLAHTYSSQFKFRTTGLRFFSVYGPWGRPDMAYFIFTKRILNNEPIKVYNNGECMRDFTYIEDIIDGITRVVESKNDYTCISNIYKVYNIGNSCPMSINELISALEASLNIKAIKELLPAQLEDADITYANIDAIHADYGFIPKTKLEAGIPQFVNWYKVHYKFIIEEKMTGMFQ